MQREGLEKMKNDSGTRILVIEDELSVRMEITACLEDQDYKILEAKNGRIGLEAFRRETPHLILLDLHITVIDGLEVLAAVNKESPETPIIVVSEGGVIGDAVEALRLGAWDYVLKPIVDMNILLHAVQLALERSKLLLEIKTHQENLEKLVKDRTLKLESEITERKRIQAELLKEKDFSDWVLKSLPGIFYLFDEDGNFFKWNKNLEGVTGYTSVEIRNIKPTDFFADQEKDLISETIHKVFAVGRAHVEANLVTKDKDKIPYYFTGFKLMIDGKKCVLGVGVDISVQKQAEKRLGESEKKYRAIVDDMPAMICRFTMDGRLSFVNEGYCKYFNRKPEECIGRDFFQLIPEAERETVRGHFLLLDQNIPIRTHEHQGIFPDRTIHWMEWTDRALFDEQGRVVEYQSIGRDITEVKLAQEEKTRIQKQLQQAQRMEAIGTLAGGIAHDFNNILGAIIGYAGMMEMFDIPAESPLRPKLKMVLQAANRAKKLVQQILTFSRQTEQERRPINLNYIVKEAIKFLRASLPTTIEIRQKIADEELIAMADPTQIHQVLLNLCTNAGYAMMETGGILEVELSPLNLDAQSTERFTELKPGPHLQLTVRDIGHGMTPEVMERIFDPFFTTKKPGEGTGMGLAVVHGIVKSHEGVITVESELGKGTTFQVIFPRIEMAEVKHDTRKALAMPTGTERILIIDDELSLVSLSKEILMRLGYEVVTKTSSGEALDLFRSQPERFDLIITDQTMPRMTGIELGREMIRIRSDIPVILCTGHSEIATPGRVEAMGIRKLIHKPLDAYGLAQTIRDVLDQAVDMRSRLKGD